MSASCVQRDHVGVSVPRSGRPGVSLLPGVVRPDTLSSDRGRYLFTHCSEDSDYIFSQNLRLKLRLEIEITFV